MVAGWGWGAVREDFVMLVMLRKAGGGEQGWSWDGASQGMVSTGMGGGTKPRLGGLVFPATSQLPGWPLALAASLSEHVFRVALPQNMVMSFRVSDLQMLLGFVG